MPSPDPLAHSQSLGVVEQLLGIWAEPGAWPGHRATQQPWMYLTLSRARQQGQGGLLQSQPNPDT